MYRLPKVMKMTACRHMCARFGSDVCDLKLQGVDVLNDAVTVTMEPLNVNRKRSSVGYDSTFYGRKASVEHNLTSVRCKAAIEDFEDKFGQNAIINKPSGLHYSAYTKEIRKQGWVWFLKNCTHEYVVQDLLNKINESPDFEDIEDFADGISRGYDQLSNLIKQKVLTPGTGIYRYTTVNPKANRAIEVFMDISI